MNLKIKTFATGIAMSAFFAAAVHADGVYPVFLDNGDYVDDIEIIGDVFLPSGQEMAALEMRNEYMKFFVDPEGIYVTLDPSNPILTDSPAFFGYWISTQSPDVGNWPVCDTKVQDEYGNYYKVHGEVMWTNIGMTDDYDIAFNAYFSSCDGSQDLWLFNNEYFVLNDASAVPHDDIPDQNTWTVVDEFGFEFIMEVIDSYAVLTSVDQFKITVQMATDPVTYEEFIEQEVMLLSSDCSTSSQHHGYGTWSWANGGFVANFDDGTSFSFPRMDGPPDNSGACRM